MKEIYPKDLLVSLTVKIEKDITSVNPLHYPYNP